MNKKRVEIAIIALAVMFVCFALGYFAGRGSVPSEVSFSSGGVVITPAVTQSPDPDGHAAAMQSSTPKEAPSGTPAPTTTVPAVIASDTPSPEVTPPAASTAPGPSDPVSEESPAVESHYTADGLLRINYATRKELEKLPGIGEVLASRIVEYREQNGSFSKLTTLKTIKGIGDSRYNAIKDLITVD